MGSKRDRARIDPSESDFDRLIEEKERNLRHAQRFLDDLGQDDLGGRAYLAETTQMLERDLDRLRRAKEQAGPFSRRSGDGREDGRESAASRPERGNESA